MKKKVIFDRLARRELEVFNPGVQDDFNFYVSFLEEHGKLEFPDARKIATNLFEIRVKHKGEYRGFYMYTLEDIIVLLHFFQKKTQKTPQRNKKIA